MFFFNFRRGTRSTCTKLAEHLWNTFERLRATWISVEPRSLLVTHHDPSTFPKIGFKISLKTRWKPTSTPVQYLWMWKLEIENLFMIAPFRIWSIYDQLISTTIYPGYLTPLQNNYKGNTTMYIPYIRSIVGVCMYTTCVMVQTCVHICIHTWIHNVVATDACLFECISFSF